MAVSMQLEDSSLLYRDNPKKLSEIENNVKFLAQKYGKFFGNIEILTLNTTLTTLLDAFNDYIDDENNKQHYQDLIEDPVSFEYFDTDKNTEKNYDVGIMFNPDSGLLTLPFYGTLKKIYETEDYKSIKGYKKCVKRFLTDDKIPPYALEKLYAQYGETFLQRTSEILNFIRKPDLESLLREYKYNFLDKQYFSSPTVLYSSLSFEKLMVLTSRTEKAQQVNAGRNASCPCGSGKKFKKCCM
jgi:hypothetical protein